MSAFRIAVRQVPDERVFPPFSGGGPSQRYFLIGPNEQVWHSSWFDGPELKKSCAELNRAYELGRDDERRVRLAEERCASGVFPP